MRNLVVAVDVGTSSARAGLFDLAGAMLARAEHPIVVNNGADGSAEFDSEDIWRAVARAVVAMLAKAGIDGRRVAAIGFDATCSLVVRGIDGGQVSVSSQGEDRWDTIAWFDHRAIAEADECSATRHVVLDHVGGVMSPEMETPKLMWLKRNRPQSWMRAGHFFDLADFLTWRATGMPARSQCTLTAKWTYLAHAGGWQRDFFDRVGLSDLLERGQLPDVATAVGAPVGVLTPEAATDLGLSPECFVASGLIDAFAGALGTIGGLDRAEIERNVALIAGTSSCLMGLSYAARPATGIWGPYFGAAIPGMWQWEGGQSATGALLDHIIRLFGNGRVPDRETHEAIVRRIGELRRTQGEDFANGIHVLPDFHGNRSPLADPRAKGMVIGLTLDTSFDSLCRIYWRTAIAIGLGLRHILDHLASCGYRIDTLQVTGGHRRNPLLLQIYADTTGCTVVETAAEDAVLLGSAMNAAAAAGLFPDLPSACRSMQPTGARRIAPDPENRYESDYNIYLKLIELQNNIK